MEMGYDLNIEQTQKLVMTPELRQALNILQLPVLELKLYIEQQLQENPLLEIQEDVENETEQDSLNNKEDQEWMEYFQDSSDLGLESARESYNYENFLTNAPTLTEHLIFQLHLADTGDCLRSIGGYLIGNIDENGYLQISLEETSERLKVDLKEVEESLKVIQTFDPAGVGARSLEECLLIQINQLGIKDELLTKVVKNYLSDLGKGKLGQIAHKLGVDVKEIQRVADIIKTLDPKPGRKFGSNEVRYIVPDVILEKVGGDYIVIINDTFIPRLKINLAYRKELNQDGDPKTRRFIENKINAAAWLIRSIEQRRMTLYKVACCLVELQRDFLDHGIKYLKPLNLKHIAEMLGLHESTVSRATSNKYIQTPQGIFEMKYFFSSGLENKSGQKTSAESIKKMLEEIIAEENPRTPLSDQKLAEFFQKKGIKISRRTIAKYRDELGIPPTRQRIRY